MRRCMSQCATGATRLFVAVPLTRDHSKSVQGSRLPTPAQQPPDAASSRQLSPRVSSPPLRLIPTRDFSTLR